MECLKIDFVGPFPDGGYILVIVCTFTHLIELYHTPDATALSAAESLLKHFGRFGTPYQLSYDNGSYFNGKRISPPYWSQTLSYSCIL